MNSFQQSKRSRRTLLVLTIIVFFIAGSDYLSGGFVRSSVRDAIGVVNGGALKMVSAVSSAKPFSSRQALTDENARLRAEIRTLSSYKIQNEILEAENNALRALVQLQEEVEALATARIVSSLKSSPFSTLVLGVGADSGVNEGDHAVLQGGVAIGNITEVGNKTSLVTLFTAPSKTTEVLIHDTLVEMHGRGGGNAVIELPREMGVSEGDFVFIRGGRFIAGVVGRIELTPADAFQHVYVSVPSDIQSQQFVTIFPGAL